MNDRSVDCIWTEQLSRASPPSHAALLEFLPAEVEWPALKRSNVCMHYPSLVRFISGGSRIHGERLLSSSYPCSSDVIPWNHRGGVFSCVRIERQVEFSHMHIVRSLSLSPLHVRRLQMERMENKRANYKVRIVYVSYLSHLKILSSKIFFHPFLFKHL